MPAQVRSRRAAAASESNTREGCPPVRSRKSPGQTQPDASPPRVCLGRRARHLASSSNYPFPSKDRRLRRCWRLRRLRG
eukprot:2516094-Prymnesium_polylepis.1